MATEGCKKGIQFNWKDCTQEPGEKVIAIIQVRDDGELNQNDKNKL